MSNKKTRRGGVLYETIRGRAWLPQAWMKGREIKPSLFYPPPPCLSPVEGERDRGGKFQISLIRIQATAPKGPRFHASIISYPASTSLPGQPSNSKPVRLPRGRRPPFLPRHMKETSACHTAWQPVESPHCRAD